MKSSGLLPLQFDAEILEKEFLDLSKQWVAHFNTSYYSGDWSGIQLRAPKGENHQISPGHAGTKEFADSPVLDQLPYIKEVISAIEAPKDSIRFLRLTPGSKIKPHKDFDLEFWDGFVRLHVPILTNEKVHFELDGIKLDMKPGECWFGDFSKTHSVFNGGETERVHLVIDCQVNDWMTTIFEEAGILEVGEQKPHELSKYDNATKAMIIEELKRIGGAGAEEAIERVSKSINE